MASKIEFLTVNETARHLGVSAWTVRDLLRRGKLRGIDVSPGKRRPTWRIPRAALTDFVNEQINERRKRDALR